MGLPSIEDDLSKKSFMGFFHVMGNNEMLGGKFEFSLISGGTLELFKKEDSPFGSFAAVTSCNEVTTAIIYGMSEDQIAYTLLGYLHEGKSSGNITVLRYKIYRYFTGEHINSLEDLKVKSFSFRLTGLEAWYCHYLVTYEYETKVAKYTSISPIILFDKDNIRVELYRKTKVEEKCFANVLLSAGLYIKITNVSEDMVNFYTTDKNGNSIVILYDLLYTFFSFLIGNQVFSYDQNIYYRKEITQIPEHLKEQMKVSQIEQRIDGKFYQCRDYELFSGKEISYTDIAFPYPALKELLPQLFVNWINNKEIISKEIYDLIEFRKRKSHSQSALALLIFCFEGLHTRKYGKNIVDIEKIRQRIRAIDRKYGRNDDMSLNERLFHGIAMFSNELGNLDDKTILKIVKILVEHRNFVGHKNHDKDKLNGEDIILFALFMDSLLSCVIADIIDIPRELLNKWLSQYLILTRSNLLKFLNIDISVSNN